MPDPLEVILTNDKEFLEELIAKVVEVQRELTALMENMREEEEEAECRGLQQ